MPAEVSADMSNLPPALVMKRALPPVLVSRKWTIAALFVVTVAQPAVRPVVDDIDAAAADVDPGAGETDLTVAANRECVSGRSGEAPGADRRQKGDRDTIVGIGREGGGASGRARGRPICGRAVIVARRTADPCGILGDGQPHACE